MPKGLLVGGPEHGQAMDVEEIETLVGWDISILHSDTGVRHVYMNTGKQNPERIWLFKYIGPRVGGMRNA